MCTVVVAWRALPADRAVRLVLAANRDELRARPSVPPHLLALSPGRWGGQDLLAGGTWLAVDAAGRVAAVTNRHPGGRVPDRDPSRRSRGALPLDLLAGDDDDARRLLSSLQPQDYNPVNLVYLGHGSAWWAAVDDEDGTRVDTLPAGVHVLAEDDLDDSGAKTRAIGDAARQVVAAADSGADAVAGLRAVLSSHQRHGDAPQTAACIHEERYGTVSSATVVVTGASVAYEHADGPPCTSPYRPVPLLEV